MYSYEYLDSALAKLYDASQSGTGVTLSDDEVFDLVNEFMELSDLIELFTNKIDRSNELSN